MKFISEKYKKNVFQQNARVNVICKLSLICPKLRPQCVSVSLEMIFIFNGHKVVHLLMFHVSMTLTLSLQARANHVLIASKFWDSFHWILLLFFFRVLLVRWFRYWSGAALAASPSISQQRPSPVTYSFMHYLAEKFCNTQLHWPLNKMDQILYMTFWNTFL